MSQNGPSLFSHCLLGRVCGAVYFPILFFIFFYLDQTKPELIIVCPFDISLYVLAGATNKPQELDDAVLRRLVSYFFLSFSLSLLSVSKLASV